MSATPRRSICLISAESAAKERLNCTCASSAAISRCIRSNASSLATSIAGSRTACATKLSSKFSAARHSWLPANWLAEDRAPGEVVPGFVTAPDFFTGSGTALISFIGGLQFHVCGIPDQARTSQFDGEIGYDGVHQHARAIRSSGISDRGSHFLRVRVTSLDCIEAQLGAGLALRGEQIAGVLD